MRLVVSSDEEPRTREPITRRVEIYVKAEEIA